MTSGLKLIAAALLGLSVLAASPGETAAKPLSSVSCVKLVDEHTELAKSGIEEAMNEDPENAGAALNRDQLARIERFLFIEGQIRFRCPEILLPGLETGEPSITQAVELKKKQTKKPKGPVVPTPRRKPNPPSKRPG